MTTTTQIKVFAMLVLALGSDLAAAAEQTATPQKAAPAVASPQGPWIGTWKRNREKSTGAINGSAVMKMWVEGDGFRYTMDSTPDSGGPANRGEAFGRFDGQPYAEKGNPVADHNVFTRVDDHTYSLVDLKDGKEVIRFTITISPDGKTRTSVAKRRDAQGQEVTTIGVWDRIE